eukprot:TRINITY_DN8346_c0_g1_i3.p1 TRINITY_DN8346_c0_g1~~TRINITY_DN8346_c0_g1_i3.p1  ORF type:complete len:251 (+),score=23.26 TRINITY_DN8346_c0_g1_i3:28-780(+)
MEIVVSKESKERISDAFPPTDEKQRFLIARVHDDITEADIDNFSNEDIEIQYLSDINDLKEIRLLHKEWFPVDYHDNFYKSMSLGYTKTLIVLWKKRSLETKRILRTHVIGCMTFEERDFSPKYMNLSFLDWFSSYRSVYIMTLGVVKEFRKKGIATLLLRRLQEEVSCKPNVRYIYLHVISYNTSAQAFYEKNNFLRLKMKKNHYNIDEKRYDAIIYALYVNGGRPPRPFCSCIRRAFAKIFGSYSTLS